MNLLNSNAPKISLQGSVLWQPWFKDKYMFLGLFIIACLSFLVFYDSFYIQTWQPHNLHVVSDVPVHITALRRFQDSHNFPVYSLWFRLIDLTAGSSKNYNTLSYIAIFYLVFFVTLKYIMTYSILRTTQTKTLLTLFAAISLVIVMPILSYYESASYPNVSSLNNFHLYLGNIAPNQWHNSTLILAMPFNLGLFYFSVKYAESDRLRSFFTMGALSLISILCKPNYALNFLPAFCLYLLFLNYKEKTLFKGLIKTGLIAIPSILVLLFQWYFTFKHYQLSPYVSKTIISPLTVWKLYSPHIFVSLLLSIAFPLTIAVLYFKKIDLYLGLSWFVFIVSLCAFSLLAEYPIYASADYLWGAIAANYILFLFSMRVLLPQVFDWKAKAAYFIFGLHLLSGLFCLGHFFIYQTSLLS